MSHPPAPAPATRWGRDEWRRLGAVLLVVTLLNAVAWTVLVGVVLPQHLALGTTVFGLGIGVTAFTLGARHAFDADHIAAIDNTTRKLLADGRRSVSVGFWFAVGHSLTVVGLAVAIAVGARTLVSLTAEGSPVRADLGVVGTSASGLFLYLIGVLNLLALVGIVRVHRRARTEGYDAAALDRALDRRGVYARVLRPLLRAVTRPWHMLPVGALLGVGFDTATEVTLLVLAGSGAAAGLPWYAVLVLPLLFAAGMTLFDTLDGAFMSVAYRWAFAHPVRKLYYNLTITGLSVGVALLVGTVELVGVLHARLHLDDAVTTWIAGLSLDNVGFVIVGLFVVVWAAAVAYWKLAHVEERWAVGSPVD